LKLILNTFRAEDEIPSYRKEAHLALWCMFSSEMFRCVPWVKRNNVSDECTESIFVVE
jgi:hypothetical protein